MIKNIGCFHVKNVKAPKKLSIVLEAAINNFNTGANKAIDLLPYEYFYVNKFFYNKSKSTGDVIQDLKNYIADVVDVVTKNCFYDITKQEECKRYIRTLDKEIDARCIDLITVPALNRLNLKFIENIDISDSFTVFIRDVDEDLEMFGGGDFDSIAKFISLFKCNEHSNNYYENKNGIINLNQDNYTLTLTLKEFINSLIRIFFYCLSQSYRDYITASVIHHVNNHLKTQYDNVLCWDNKIKKYFGIRSITMFQIYSNDSDFYFCLNDISPTTSFNLKTENQYEFTNYIDKLRYDFKNPSVFITKPSETLKKNSLCSSVFSYVAYLPYEEKSINKIASIQLTATLKDLDSVVTINQMLYDTNPLYNLYDLNKNFKIGYNKLYMDKSIKELIDKNMLDFNCSICYYNNTTKTRLNREELKEKNIPKFKRDIVYKAFCHLCYELELDPMKIKNQLDVHFTKYYKEPIEF